MKSLLDTTYMFNGFGKVHCSVIVELWKSGSKSFDEINAALGQIYDIGLMPDRLRSTVSWTGEEDASISKLLKEHCLVVG